MQVDPPSFLNPPALAKHGIDGWPLGIKDCTHFHELDTLGHVNNIAYLQWFENARIVWLMVHGFTQYHPNDLRYVVRSQSARYDREMGLGQSYIVTVGAAALRTTSFTLRYAVFAAGEITALGESVMVQMDTNGHAKHPLDARRRAVIEAEIADFTS